MLAAFREKHKLNKAFETIAQNWYIPLAQAINKHQLGAKGPYFVAINGCQGSGKSTLSDFLKEYLQAQYQLNIVALSLDDFYLSKSDRLALSIKVHPLFNTRGVPGTHDMRRVKQVLDDVAQNQPTLVPRFDKSSDNLFPEDSWEIISDPVNVVIFEGWCWGVEHQLASKLQFDCNGLETEHDSLGVWRQFVNKQLEMVYEPLYSIMDYWIMLKAPSFENVYAWRLEQEQKLAQSNSDNSNEIMNAEQIRHFIHHYQRLTEQALETLPDKCDLVFNLNEKREIIDCTQKD